MFKYPQDNKLKLTFIVVKSRMQHSVYMHMIEF